MPQTPPEPYGSARDLPSFQQMEQQLQAFELLGFLLSSDQAAEMSRLRTELTRMSSLVDRFYGLLGQRNWVYSDQFDMTAVGTILDTEDSAEAERRLIAHYNESEHLKRGVMRLRRHKELRARLPLVEKAFIDHKSGRYYSVVLVLLVVMDGFVNELDPAHRKGLHAREVPEMVAWDSVVGHHLGLSHAHASFVKSFFKTDETEVVELHRNGILHGTLPNFDNQIVATKAWNRLFAIADWAIARRKHAEPVVPQTTLRESLQRWQDVQAHKKQLDEWEPHECDGDDPECEVASATRDFLARWEAKQWGPMGAAFPSFGSTQRTVGQRAREAKDLYATHDLTAWLVDTIRHSAAAVALVDVHVDVNGVRHSVQLRWIRTGEDGRSVAEWQNGTWSLATYGPATFLPPSSPTRDRINGGEK